jgi:AcrR family transcriptional regulator
MTESKRKNGTGSSRLGQRRKSAQANDKTTYAARRQEIVESAAVAFREEGYDRTTLSDIAKRAGTDRASVYYYVSSKEELFQEVCGGMLDANIVAAEDIASRDITAQEKLQLIITHFMSTHERGYPQWSVLVQEMKRITEANTTWSRDAVAKMKRFESIVISIIEGGIAEGSIRDDVPPLLAMNAIFGMLNWTHRWFRPDGKYNSSAVAAAFTAIALDGLSVGH